MNVPQEFSDFTCNLSDMINEADLYEQNILVHIAGYVVFKAKKRFACSDCFNKMSAQDSDDVNAQFLQFLEAKRVTNLVIPSPDMIQFITECEDVFLKKFQKVIHRDQPRSILVKYLKKAVSARHICCRTDTCLPIVDYVRNLFLVVRINHALTRQNREFQTKGTSRNRKILKLTHV